MSDVLVELSRGKRVLLVAATPMEARAAAAGFGATLPDESPWTLQAISNAVDVLITGVGKAPAAGATARCCDPLRHALVLSVGVAGVLPGAPTTLAVRSALWADRCTFADEGAVTPDGFIDLAQMGFPPTSGSRWGGVEYRVDDSVVSLGRALGAAVQVGGVATVSVCSGTAESADAIARRTGCVGEAMEGAAIALSADRLGVPAGELRTISNFTGPRLHQQWDIKGALASLTEVLGRLHAVLRG